MGQRGARAPGVLGPELSARTALGLGGRSAVLVTLSAGWFQAFYTQSVPYTAVEREAELRSAPTSNGLPALLDGRPAFWGFSSLPLI